MVGTGKKCCVPNCNNTKDEAMLHRFPVKLPEVYRQWIANIGRIDLQTLDPVKVYKNYRVCHDHFEAEVKIDPTKYFCRSQLKKGACPVLSMPQRVNVAGPSTSRDDHCYYVPAPIQGPSTSTDDQSSHVAALISGSSTWAEDHCYCVPAPIQGPSTSTDEQSSHVAAIISGPSTWAEDHCYHAPHPLINEPQQLRPKAAESADVAKQKAREPSPSELDASNTPHGEARSAPEGGRKGIRRRLNLLQVARVTRAAQLTPRAKSLYKLAGQLRRVARDLNTENLSLKERCKAALEYAESEEFFNAKVNKTTVNFLLSQLKLQNRGAKGRRYTLDDKIFALALMKQSPRGYKLLQKVFALPSRKTLNNLLRRIPFHCGMNKPIMQAIARAASKMPKLDRYAVLMWDEISLEPALTFEGKDDQILGFKDVGSDETGGTPKIADHALVFMLRGVRRKWKQPIAYFLCDSAMGAADLKRNVTHVIREVRACGLKVVATISDQLQTNCAVISSLEADTRRWCIENNVENRYFGYTVDGEEVVHIFDPPHLLKGIRNNLLIHDVHFTWKHNRQQLASWRDVQHLYELDSRHEDDYKMCSRLTEEHIYPEKIKKMRVKLAAQVFSQRVASIMHSLGENEPDVPKSYTDTSDFLLFFDKLFDSVNGATIRAMDGKRLRTAISSTSEHLRFWEEALPVLRSIQFSSAKRSGFVPPSVTNWTKTIRGLRYLWRQLQAEGFEFLALRNFNQDPLENFFGLIRSHGVRNVNPTPAAFKASFRSLIINNFMATHSPGSNCEEDSSGAALTSLREFIMTGGEEGVDTLEVAVVDDEPFHIAEEQNVLQVQLHAYLAGYVAKKLLSRTKCRRCRTNLLCSEAARGAEHILIGARAYSPRALVYTDTRFRTLFGQSCQVAHHYLPKFCNRANVSKLLVAKLHEHVLHRFYTTITCADHNMLQMFGQFFVRFYIHTWCGNVNKILKGLEQTNLNDAIKQLAHNKCIKRRGHRERVRQMKGLA